MFVGMGYGEWTTDRLEQELIAAEAERSRLATRHLAILEELDRRQVATGDGCPYRRDSGDLYDPATGKHVSRFHGPEVYSPKGTYLGELTQTGRLPNREPDQARPHFPKTRPSKRDRERRRDGRRSPGRSRTSTGSELPASAIEDWLGG
jgi:hypothetical protein